MPLNDRGRKENSEYAGGSRRPLALLMALALAGCSLAKRDAYDVPEVALPAGYKNPAPTSAQPGKPAPVDTAAALPAGVQDGGLVEWWRSFGNIELEGLVDRALANNADIRIATLRVAQAKSRAEQAAAGKLPTLTAPGLMAIQSPGGSSAGSVPLGGSGGGGSSTLRSYQGSLKGEYRLDIWGEQSALAESASLQLWRAAFERDNVQRNVVANLASSYVEYVSLNDRLRVAKETEAVLAASLTAIQKRTEAGDATLTDFEQQRAAIFAVRATIPSLEQQREEAAANIAFTVGTVPGALKLSEAGLDSLALPRVIPGLPSALLLRRPDVRMMEARLLSADADIDVARARILPSIDLSSQVGYSSLFLTKLFTPQALFWNALSSITASIFDGGRRRAEKDYAEAIQEEMVETYVRTIYQAMREVETALTTIRLAGKRLDAQHEATLSARKAWDISADVYAAGAVDYLMLLDTERTYHRHLDEYQHIQMDYYRGYISLFHALGGGVKTSEMVPGRGARPPVAAGGKVISTAEARPPAPPVTVEGVNWSADQGMQIEEFWQVELPGLYHRNTISAVWRDLRNRFPEIMASRILRPHLAGKIEDSTEGAESWYRLTVAKFPSVEAAESFCIALQTGQQRCRILSSRSNEPVKPSKRVSTATGPVEVPTPAPSVPAAATPAAPERVQAVVEPVAAPSAVPAAVPAPAEPSREVPRVEATAPAPMPAPEKPAAAEKPGRTAYAVRLGAYSTLDKAAEALPAWRKRGVTAYVLEAADAREGAYTINAGTFAKRRDGVALVQVLRRKGETGAVLVSVPVDKNGKPAAVPEPVAASRSEAATPAPQTAKPVEKGPASVYTVQLGAFDSPENARRSLDFWRGKGVAAYAVALPEGGGYAVRSGQYDEMSAAAAVAASLGKREGVSVTVVPALLGSGGRPVATNLEQLAAPSEKPAPAVSAPAAPLPAKAAPETRSVAKPRFTVQLGAFSTPENAAKGLAEWKERGTETYISPFRTATGKVFYGLRTGEFASQREAAAAAQTLSAKERLPAMAVPTVLDADGRVVRLEVAAPLPEGTTPGSGGAGE